MGFPDQAFGDDFGPSRPHRVRFGAIGEGWGLFKERWTTWVLAGLIVLMGNSALLGALQPLFHAKLPAGGRGFRFEVPPATELIPAVIVAMVNGLFLGGMFRLAGLQIRGRRITLSDFFGVIDVFGELALGSAVLGLGLSIAASFCFVPALILAGTWMFTIPLIVDGRLRAFEAVKRSWGALAGQWLSATLFHAVVSLVAGLGGCCFFLGICFTMPLYCLSISVLYRDVFLSPGPDDLAKPAASDPDF